MNIELFGEKNKMLQSVKRKKSGFEQNDHCIQSNIVTYLCRFVLHFWPSQVRFILDRTTPILK